jgi:hypothetical protein
MYDQDTQFRLAALRQKVLAGTASIDEMRESLVILRQGRLTHTVRKAAQGKTSDRTAKPAPSVGAMLGELAGLG